MSRRFAHNSKSAFVGVNDYEQIPDNSNPVKIYPGQTANQVKWALIITALVIAIPALIMAAVSISYGKNDVSDPLNLNGATISNLTVDTIKVTTLLDADMANVIPGTWMMPPPPAKKRSTATYDVLPSDRQILLGLTGTTYDLRFPKQLSAYVSREFHVYSNTSQSHTILLTAALNSGSCATSYSDVTWDSERRFPLIRFKNVPGAYIHFKVVDCGTLTLIESRLVDFCTANMSHCEHPKRDVNADWADVERLEVSSFIDISKGNIIDSVQGHEGVVSSSDHRATEIGTRVLASGGNAFDAAVAIQYALGVVEPYNTGLGGGAFIVGHDARTGKTFSIDGRETAPSSYTPTTLAGYDSFFDFAMVSSSGLAVGVPGTPRAFELLHQKYGKTSHRDLIQPAIDLAENGFIVTSEMTNRITNPDIFFGRNQPSTYPATAAIYKPGGNIPQPGSVLTNADLAKTLRLIQQYGVDVLYHDDVAPGVDIPQAIIDAVQETVTTQFSNQNCLFVTYPSPVTTVPGNMSKADFESYEAKMRPVLSFPYRDIIVKTMGPPTSGGLTFGMILKMLESLPIGNASAQLPYGNLNTLNAQFVATGIAFSDRAKWFGDPDFLPYKQAKILDTAYMTNRSSGIPCTENAGVYNCATAGGSVSSGTPPFDFSTLPTTCPVSPPARKRSSLSSHTLPNRNQNFRGKRSRATTHFSVTDKDGNYVAVTSTIEQEWGSGIVVPGYGFLLNNELTDFNFVPKCDLTTDNDPGANDAGPGKRPRSSMSPTILFDQSGAPFAALGTRGGPTMIDTLATVLSNYVDHKFSMQNAIDLPRIENWLYSSGLIIAESSSGVSHPAAFQTGLAALGSTYPSFFSANSCSLLGWVPAVFEINGTQHGATDCQRFCTTSYGNPDFRSGTNSIVTCANTTGIQASC